MKLNVIGLGAAVFIGAAFLFLPAQSAKAASEHGICQGVSVAVALAPGKPANKNISGALCTPHDWAPGEHGLDLLAHGGSYDRDYWDFPFEQPQYSYVDRALQQGRATLTYDRLGVGKSSRPLSAQVTVEADAHILHQVIGWAGEEKGYEDITLIGHSLGSVVALAETASHNDADRLVLTGLLHTFKPRTLLAFGTAIYPAMLDPQFFGKIFDPGYVTTIPGTRAGLFYSQPADPNVIAYDEAHKDVFGAVQIAGTLTTIEVPAALNVSQQVTVPVLLQVGAEDVLFCGGALGLDCSSDTSVIAHEAAYFTNAESLSASVIPGTGHDLTLHPTADDSFNAINSWVQTH